MKSLLSFALVFLAFSAFSAFADTTCTGTTQYHSIKLDQVGTDVEIIIEQNKLSSVRIMGNESEGKYKTSGLEKSIMIIQGINITDFLKKRELAVDVVVSMILGRREFEGDEDIVYLNAETFLRSLNCK